jgi:hypothetical protein
MNIVVGSFAGEYGVHIVKLVNFRFKLSGHPMSITQENALKDTSIGMKGCFNADNNNAVYLKSLLQKSTKYLLANYL